MPMGERKGARKEAEKEGRKEGDRRRRGEEGGLDSRVCIKEARDVMSSARCMQWTNHGILTEINNLACVN